MVWWPVYKVSGGGAEYGGSEVPQEGDQDLKEGMVLSFRALRKGITLGVHVWPVPVRTELSMGQVSRELAVCRAWDLALVWQCKIIGVFHHARRLAPLLLLLELVFTLIPD